MHGRRLTALICLILAGGGLPAAGQTPPGPDAPSFKIQAVFRETPEGGVFEVSGGCDAPESSVVGFLVKFGGEPVPNVLAGAVVDASFKIAGRLEVPAGKRLPRGRYLVEAALDPQAQDPGLAWYFAKNTERRVAKAPVRVGTPAEERRDYEDALKYYQDLLGRVEGMVEQVGRLRVRAADEKQALDAGVDAQSREIADRIERARGDHQAWVDQWACQYFPVLARERIEHLLGCVEVLGRFWHVQAYVRRGREVPPQVRRPEQGDPDPDQLAAEIRVQLAAARADLEVGATLDPVVGAEKFHLYAEDLPADAALVPVPPSAGNVLTTNPARLSREQVLRLPNPEEFLRGVPPGRLVGAYWAGLGAGAPGERPVPGAADGTDVVDVLVLEFAAPEACAAEAERLGKAAAAPDGSAGAVFARDRLLVAVLPRGKPPAPLLAALVDLERKRFESPK